MIQGLCYICGKPAMHICSVCGNAVCDEHYVPELRACVECAHKAGYGKNRKIPEELRPKSV